MDPAVSVTVADEIRGVRQRRKHCDPTCCPVCGITVRPNEIEQHYTLELEKLHKPSNLIKIRKSMVSQQTKDTPSCSTTSPATATANADDPSECWTAYQRIKNNRQARLKMKSKKRKADDPLCPICNERIADDIIAHVDFCLQRSEGKSNGAHSDNGDDDDSVDVEAESFDEYEWAGQTRVRASSMLSGGYSAAGFGTQINYKGNNVDEEDEDLNVDGDDTQVFGAAQYSELDVILPVNDSNDKKGDSLYLRNLAIGQISINTIGMETTSRWTNSNANTNNNNSINITDESCTIDSNQTHQNETNAIKVNSTNSPASTSSIPDTGWSNGLNNDIDMNTTTQLSSSSSTSSTSSSSNLPEQNNQNSQKQIIESLKEKIREYEMQIRNKSKCLICIDEFRIPVVSICCWHVHCEECWLRTLGARKLCPQCNMITSPSDLRRIYM